MQSQEDERTPTERDILLKEYESLVAQLIHWDSHFWSKSQFFMVIQSAFIAVVLQAFKELVASPSNKPSPTLLYLFLFIGLFNVYLCYVWFRTNRRNREYLRQRSERAVQIESELGILRTFTDGKEKLPKGHGSANWETHLPTGFIIVWVVLLTGAVILTR